MIDLQKILVIEDSPEIVEAIDLTIGIRWPRTKIIATESGVESLELIEKEKPDLVILDLGLPDLNGFEVLRRLRLFSQVPVIVLTIRSDEADIVKGLELGANDYIVKPFRQMELLSRVNNQIRKETSESNNPPILTDKLQLYPATHEVISNNRHINLTPIESSLLSTLMINAGQVVTHANLIKKAWGEYYPELSLSLKVHIRRLRQKLESDPSKPKIILTKVSVGYYFNQPE
ncbi:MAG: response regulator transcription factor [Candidatus Bathyarchaeota archaeon]|nr:response regulator transcription factor [Candidatus Bathyarchaeota archaeon]